MPLQTCTLGTHAALEDTIAKLQQKFSDAGFNIVEHSYSNPVNNIWALQISDRDCSLLTCTGKGTSKKTALANALKKFIGYLSTHFFWAGCYFGDEISNNKFMHCSNEQWFKTVTNDSWPLDVLNGELCEFYNPNNNLNPSRLIDVNSANTERGIHCISHECLRTGETINFPTNIISNLYDSNGIGVGNSTEEARIQALTKIIEHYVKFKVIAEGASLPNLPDKVLNRYPKLQAIIEEIKSIGFEILSFDASLNGKYPVVALALLDPSNQGVRVSFGAHSSFEIALERSLTDLLPDKELDQKNNFHQAGFDSDEIASPLNLEKHFTDSNGIIAWDFLSEQTVYEFVDWDKQDTKENITDDLNHLCNLIHTAGNDIYVSDYTLNNTELDIHVCRIIIPGLSEVYPIDDLIWENNNAGMNIRDDILKPNKTIEDCEQLVERLEELNQDDQCLVSTLISMPADSDSIFKDLCIAELILLLALKTQDNERIQENCEWLLDFKNFNAHRLKVYQCINTILQLDGMANYSNALKKLYTREILSDALALIDGEDVFPLKSEWKTQRSVVDAYKKLISIQT